MSRTLILKNNRIVNRTIGTRAVRKSMDTNDSYLETSVLAHAKKRFAWLLFLMLSATITGSIIVNFLKN